MSRAIPSARKLNKAPPGQTRTEYPRNRWHAILMRRKFSRHGWQLIAQDGKRDFYRAGYRHVFQKGS